MKNSSFPFRIRPAFAGAAGICCGTVLSLYAPEAVRFAVLALGAAGVFYGILRGDRPLLFFAAFLMLGTVRAAYPAGKLPEGLKTRAAEIRETVGGRIDELFPGWPGVARGMLLGGSNTSIAGALKQRFYDIGIGHLLAVSGLHVSILAGTLVQVWRRGALRLRWTVLAVFLLFYCVLTGGSASVIRASVMLLYATPLGEESGRRDSAVSISLACVAALLWDPGSIGSASFLLSFLSVAGILLLGGPVKRALSFLPRGVAASASVSIAATVATAPVVAAMFGEISLLGIFANLLILPIVPFFLIPAFFAVAGSFLFPGTGPALSLLPRGALWAVMNLANAGGAPVMTLSAPGPAAITAFYLAVPVLSDYCLLEKKRRLAAGFGLFAAAAALWAFGL